jgi:ComF family protein
MTADAAPYARLRHLADALTAVVFAPHCAACEAVLDTSTAGPVCAACWASVLPLPPHAGDLSSPSIARWRAAGQYEHPLREIVHAFKYDERRSLAQPLGHAVRTAACDLLDDADCVVPVPLHPWRRFRRGFNQAALLARRLDRPVVHALWRRHWTPPQAGQGRGARARNVGNAFTASPLLSRRTRARFIDGRIVVLVDDVRTTGATLEACGKVLLRMGAVEIRAVAVAAVTSD